jgi:hypothetical protein
MPSLPSWLARPKMPIRRSVDRFVKRPADRLLSYVR